MNFTQIENESKWTILLGSELAWRSGLYAKTLWNYSTACSTVAKCEQLSIVFGTAGAVGSLGQLHRHFLSSFLQHLDQIFGFGAVVGLEKRMGGSCLVAARGSANSVHVVLGVLGVVEVNYILYVSDIYTTDI